MSRERAWAIGLLGLLSLLFGACAPSEVQTQWTPYRKYYQLVPKNPSCNVHVVYDRSAIPTHVGIATMTYRMKGGVAGTSPEDAADAFRAEACRIGADGVIIGEDAREGHFWGATASATAFVWGPLPPAPASNSPSVVTCNPPCRDGYVCNAGDCVTACNPICSLGEACVADGGAPKCVVSHGPIPPTSTR